MASSADPDQGPVVQSIVSLTKLLAEDLLSLTVLTHKINLSIFSLPGQSPGRAIVQPPASAAAVVALAKC